MIKLNDWLSIDKTSGGGSGSITLNASSLGVPEGRAVSLRLKTSTKEVILNVTQISDGIPENIPSNQLWVKTSDVSYPDFNTNDFEQSLSSRRITSNGWVIYTFDAPLTKIGKSALSGQRWVTNVVIPKTVVEIGQYAFQRCERLQTVYIPDSVVSIGSYVFDSCWNLEAIDIPDSVVSIGDGTFNNCANIKSITIGSGLTTINRNLFKGCTSVDTISVSPQNATFDSRSNCNCLIETGTNMLLKGSSSSFIPNGVETINSYAFQNAILSSLVIPDSVTFINSCAFSYSTIQSITIGSGVANIGYGPFNYCESLSEIICYRMTAPYLSNGIGTSIGRNGVLRYPSGATGYNDWMNNYLSNYGWTSSTI